MSEKQVSFLFLRSRSCSVSAVSLPGLGTVKRSGDQVSPAVPVEDQRLAAGQHPAAKADLSPAK